MTAYRALLSARLIARAAAAPTRRSIVSIDALRNLPSSSAPVSVTRLSRSFASSSSALLNDPQTNRVANPLPSGVQPQEQDSSQIADTQSLDQSASLSGQAADKLPSSSDAAARAASAPIVTSSTNDVADSESPLGEDTSAERVAQRSAEDEEVRRRTLFVGGLSWSVDADWLRDELCKILGDETAVKAVRIQRTIDGRSKGFGFAELSSPELVAKLDGQQAEIDHRMSGFSSANGRNPRAPTRTPRNNAMLPSNTVFIGGLDQTTTEIDLEDVFSPFGRITRTSIPIDKATGNGRGVGYVQFETVRNAEAVLSEARNKPFEILGRTVRLDFAENKRPNDGAGGYDGYRQGDGRRGGFGEGRRSDFGERRDSFRSRQREEGSYRPRDEGSYRQRDSYRSGDGEDTGFGRERFSDRQPRFDRGSRY